MVNNMSVIHCNICGNETSLDAESCKGCGTPTARLQEDVHIPLQGGLVNDFPGLLTKDQVFELESISKAFLENSGIPIVIVVIETSKPLAPDEYAFLLYNDWGIGMKEVNKGILFLLCLKERHLESEIGLGLERYLPEYESDRIVHEEFLAHFKEGKFFEGLVAGINAIIKTLDASLP